MDQTNIWDHFQNAGETADVFTAALPRYEFIAQKIAPGTNVLNIGVGRGGLESVLVEKGVLVNCLDPSQSSIDRLREEHQLGERAKVGFSQSIPFEDGYFDVVVMSEVLEHLTDDVLSKTLTEVRRVLKPNGKFMGTVPANEILSTNVVMCPCCGKSFHRWGHLQTFSLLRMHELLLAHNFTVLRNETRTFPDWRRRGWNNRIKSFIRYVLGRVGSPIASPNIYFQAIR